MAEEAEPFPILDPSEIALVESRGVRRAVAAGDHLYREGDADYDFYVVLSGVVEAVVGAGRPDEQVIAVHGHGRFLGELNMLTGQRVFVTARVTAAGEVIALPAAELRRLIATQPAFSDKVLTAYMARRASLLTGRPPPSG